jgi:hypothetical protein
MYSNDIVSYRKNVPDFQDLVNTIFQPELAQEPHVHRLQNVLFNKATPEVATEQGSGLTKKGTLGDFYDLVTSGFQPEPVREHAYTLHKELLDKATTPELMPAHQTGLTNAFSFPDFHGLVNSIFQPEATREPHIHRLQDVLFDKAAPKLAAAHQTGLINTDSFPDNSELLSVLGYADKFIACQDVWEGNAINDRVDRNYVRETTPEERHSRALDDAVQWLLKDRTTDLARFHMSKKFRIPGGHSFTADIAYELPNGKWKIYKVEQAGHDWHGHGYRDAYRGDTTKYWRELFHWMHKKDCPIEVVQIIDVDFREPNPHAASNGSTALYPNHRAHKRCP